MVCTECQQQINFDQWFNDFCTGGSSVGAFHSLGELEVRRLYSRKLTEASYARTQP